MSIQTGKASFGIILTFGRWSSAAVQICPKLLCIYSFVNKFERGGFSKGFGKCVAVRICPQFWCCRESISKNAFRWFESVYRPEMPEMHLQNFEKLQSRKKRRNLSKSPLIILLLVFCGVDRGYKNLFNFQTIIQQRFPYVF